MFAARRLTAPACRAALTGAGLGARVRAHARVCCLIAGVLAGAAMGCASSDEPTKTITYSLTAKQNYDKGVAELADESYPEATKYFTFVKQKFPFSKYAALAELGLADTQYTRGNHQEAIDAYKSFARLHPTHEKVDEGYVNFRICKCYVQEIPDDWFIFPPSSEKDQSAVLDALRELNDFLDKYPDSKFIKDATKDRRDVLRRLVEHEVYVAKFYLDRDKPKAAIMRLEGAIKRYPDSGREPELLLTLGQTQLRMGQAATAKDTFGRVVKDYAGAREALRAGLYLDFIRRQYGDTPINKTASASAGTAHG